MTKSKILLILVLAFALFAVADFALAQGGGTAPGLGVPRQPAGLPGNPSDTITEWIVRLVNYALGIVAILAVAYLIYGGFLYITSGGDSEASEAGKNAIKNAIIGLIIIILSFVVITTI